MKKMTKWLAVCAVCVMGSVPAMAAEVPDVTVTPIPIETPAPDVTPIETPAPTPIPEVKNGWYEYGTKNKKYFKDGQYLTGMRKIHGEVYYFSPKGFMKTGWIKYNNKKYYFGSNGIPTTSSHFINSLAAGKSALFVNTRACGVASSKRM